VYRREGEIGTLDLPDLNWFKPMIRFMAAIEAVIRFGLWYYVILEEFSVIFEVFFFESRADLFTKK